MLEDYPGDDFGDVLVQVKVVKPKPREVEREESQRQGQIMAAYGAHDKENMMREESKETVPFEERHTERGVWICRICDAKNYLALNEDTCTRCGEQRANSVSGRRHGERSEKQ